MDPESDHRGSIIFNAALRLALSDLADIPQKILNQPLSDCMLDDMSDLDFSDQAVNDFIDMFTGKKYSDMTVGNLRGLVAEVFSGCSASHVASRWTYNSDERGLKALSQRCSRKERLTYLNQLLAYIGGKSLNESYETAIKSPPEYPKVGEYNKINYSLGMNFTWDSADEYRTKTEVVDYQTTNLLKLLDESRYVLEDILIRLIEMGGIADANIKVNYISVYINEIEVLAFPVDQFINDLYYTDLALASKLPDTKSLTGVENLAEILLSGNLFRSPQCYHLKQRLKGKALERELGI